MEERKARCVANQEVTSLKEGDLFDLSLSSYLQFYKQGEMDHAAYLQSIQQRARQCQHLNIFTAYDEAVIQKQLSVIDQQLPLYGVPFAVKDNILTKDYPTSNGTPALQDWQPDVDANIVRQLRGLGGLLLGKLNMPEFCQHMSCNNVTFGKVGNPYNPDMIPGGSSGGCAAAVTAGLSAFSIGTDTGGSVRIPAALCGCYGFRPTTGRYSYEGIMPVTPVADTPGLLTRCVKDIQLLDTLLTGDKDNNNKQIDLSILRLGVPRDYFYTDLDQDVANIVEYVLSTLSNNSVILVEADLPNIAELNSQVGMPIVLYNMLREINFFLLRYGSSISLESIIELMAGTVEKAAIASQMHEMLVSHDEYYDALHHKLPMLRRCYDEYFHDNQLDAFIVPTTIAPAKPHTSNGPDAEIEHLQVKRSGFPTYIHNTEPSSFAGVPCISIPAGLTSKGLPVGIEIVGQRGHDRQLLQLTAAVEAILPQLPGPPIN